MEEISHRRKLINYFKKNLSKGYTSETLKWALIRQGYSRTDISRALEQANKELAEKAPVLKEKPVIKCRVIDENNNVLDVKVKKPLWKRLLGL